MNRDLADFILKRLVVVFLVLWAGWSTWHYAVVDHENAQLQGVAAQQKTQFQAVLQQAQQTIAQLQQENQKLTQRLEGKAP